MGYMHVPHLQVIEHWQAFEYTPLQDVFPITLPHSVGPQFCSVKYILKSLLRFVCYVLHIALIFYTALIMY